MLISLPLRTNILRECLLAMLHGLQVANLPVPLTWLPEYMSLYLLEGQTTAATRWQPQTNATDRSIAAPDIEIINYTTTNQELLLLQSVKTKRGSAPRKQKLEVGSFHYKPASLQD